MKSEPALTVNPDLETVIESIASITKVKNGVVCYSDDRIRDLLAVLDSILVFGKKGIPPFIKKIPPVLRGEFIRNAVTSAAKDKGISSKHVLSNINKILKKYNKKAKTKYVILVTLSISQKHLPKQIRENGFTISFGTKLNSNFRETRKQFYSEHKSSMHGDYPDDYCICKITTSSRLPEVALHDAVELVDFHRGIWNFCLNSQRITKSSSKREPVNRIIRGPLGTVHLETGKKACDACWLEHEHINSIKKYSSYRADDIIECYKLVRKGIKGNPLEPFIRAWLVKYSRALDSFDWNSSFLQLWSVLESLTCTEKSDSHEITVKRAKCIFTERDIAKIYLNHLRDNRNSSVHDNNQSMTIETLLYQLKYIVETIFQVVMYNRKLKNIGELTKFFNYLINSNELERNRTIMAMALEYSKA